jgi:hypothetical protein
MVAVGIDLKEEAALLEAQLLGGAPSKPGNLLSRKFQARAYQLTAASGNRSANLRRRSAGVPPSSASYAAAKTSRDRTYG